MMSSELAEVSIARSYRCAGVRCRFVRSLRHARSLSQSASRPCYPKCAQIDVLDSWRSGAMPSYPLPRDLHRALDRLQAEPDRPWTLAGLAADCGVAPRTLQKHFRRFLGRTPVAFLRELRLDLA